MRSLHKKVVVGLAAGLLVGLLPTTASAEGSVATKTSIRKSERKRAVIFYGTVDVDFKVAPPDAEGCLDDRAVQIWRDRRRGDKRVPGVAHSQEDGSWAGRLTGRKLKGKFYAKVTKKVFSDSYGELVTCSRTRSRTVKL